MDRRPRRQTMIERRLALLLKLMAVFLIEDEKHPRGHGHHSWERMSCKTAEAVDRSRTFGNATPNAAFEFEILIFSKRKGAPSHHRHCHDRRKIEYHRHGGRADC